MVVCFGLIVVLPLVNGVVVVVVELGRPRSYSALMFSAEPGIFCRVDDEPTRDAELGREFRLSALFFCILKNYSKNY